MAQTFITGATGFVGSTLARQLLAEGHRVRVLRRASSKLDALAGLLDHIEQVIGDLDDLPLLSAALSGVDWVFHVAAVAEYWRVGVEQIYKVNVGGTRTLLEAAQRAGVRRFIFTSSAAAVGYLGGGRLADENTPYNIPRDLSPYGMSKHLAEGWVARAVRHGLDAVTLNPTVILGAGDLNQISGSLVLEVAKRRVPFLPQNGGTNFINVEDVARAHIAAAEKGQTGERYIVGNQNLTHRALLLLISQVVGVPAPALTLPDALLPLLAILADTGRAFGLQLPVDGNQLRLSARQLYFDTSKMRRELYEPQVDIQQTLEETWAWYQARGLKSKYSEASPPLSA